MNKPMTQADIYKAIEEIDEVVSKKLLAIEQAEKQQALDKKADNARELGLDYEPEPVAWMTNSEQDVTAEFLFSHVKTPMHNIPLYEAPPKSDNELYAIDKSINEEIERLKTEINRLKELAEYRLKLLMKMPEQADQEPVAWVCEGFGKEKHNIDYEQEDVDALPVGTMLYTAPQKYCPSENNAAYEKGFVEGMAKQMHSSVDRAVNTMTKQWVGLTDDDLRQIILVSIGVAEAKLKGKNGG